MRRRDFLRLGAAVTAGAILPSAPRAAGVIGKRPNILIILADDMGYSDPGYMGGEARTPHLDQIAANGVVFVNCVNNCKCAPTRASLMTGLYNQRTDAVRGAGGNINEGDSSCLAEHLRDAGYATILSGKWHINPHPLQAGFQKNYGSLMGAVYFKPKDNGRKTIQIDHNGQPAEIPDDWYSTIAYTDHAIASAKEAIDAQKPFFLYLAYHAPHWPLQALEEDIAKYRGRYQAGTDAMRKERYERMARLGIVNPATWKLPELEEGAPAWDTLNDEQKQRTAAKLAVVAAMMDRMNSEIGRFLDFLKKENVLDNTLIFFLSDNGASAEGGTFGKFDCPSTARIGSADSFITVGTLAAVALDTPLRKYKTTLYEGGKTTSLVVHWPGHTVKKEEYRRDLCHVLDIFPTCLEAAGCAYPQNYRGRMLHPLDGKSLVPALRGEAIGERTFCANYKQHRSVLNSRWKMDGEVATGGRKEKPWELYDLSVDRSETKNVASVHPDIVKELSAKWDVWNADVRATEQYDEYVARKEGKKPKNKRNGNDNEEGDE